VEEGLRVQQEKVREVEGGGNREHAMAMQQGAADEGPLLRHARGAGRV
jgi:hypothetical protein